jgi:hypothetical protein
MRPSFLEKILTTVAGVIVKSGQESSIPDTALSPVALPLPAEKTRPEQWRSVVLEEYRALRAESLESMRNQHQVLVYAFALVGLLAIGAAQVWDETRFVVSIIFLFAIPSLSYCFVIIWIGEVARMMRAGHLIAQIERGINKSLPSPALGWETWLRTPAGTDVATTHQNTSNYKAVLVLLLGMGLCSTPVGVVAAWQGSGKLGSEWWIQVMGYQIAWIPVVGTGVLAVANLIAFLMMVRWVRSRARYFATL